MQLDIVSRRILSPESLRTRRRMEQRHDLEQAIAHQMGHIQETILPTPIDIITEPTQIQELIQILTCNTTKQEEQQFKSKSMKKQKLILVGIATDTSIGISFQEWYLHLILIEIDEHDTQSQLKASSQKHVTMGRRIQVPLVPFALQLADTFDGKVTSTAFCFIADASSGLGTHVLTVIAKKCDLVSWKL